MPKKRDIKLYKGGHRVVCLIFGISAKILKRIFAGPKSALRGHFSVI